MTSPEFGGIQPLPEFDREKPTELFPYVAAMWKFNERRFEPRVRQQENRELVAEANEYIDAKFGRLPERRPELTVIAKKVFHTTGFSNPIDGTDIIESSELPEDDDYQVMGAHHLRATLHNFYISRDGELRVSVGGSGEPVYLDGGVYIPYLSVPLEGSSIEFSAYTEAEKIKALDEYIYKTSQEYSEEVIELLKIWKSLMKAPNETVTKKLQNSSYVIGEIAKHEETTSDFVAALLEIMTLRFGLYSHHDIKVASHRKRIPLGFIQGGPELFTGVTPTIELMGETVIRQKIGLTFDDGEGLIEIPAESIEAIYKSK